MVDKYNEKNINNYEDYGLNSSLEDISKGIDKILESNKDLILENDCLKNRIKELESNINILIENNKNLINWLKVLEEKEKTNDPEIIEETPNVKVKEKDTEISMGKNQNQLREIKENKSIEDYKKILREIDKEDYTLLLNILKEILNLKDERIEDDFAEYIINLIQEILENKKDLVRNIEILNLIESLYEEIDEDLLIEFTELNYVYILELIEAIGRRPINFIIKIGRILYSVERIIPADDFLALLNFKYLKPYVKDQSKIMELLLIYNHLLGCKKRNEIRHLWPEIWHKGYTETIDLLTYLKTTEEVDRGEFDKVNNSISHLSKRFSYISKIESEVESDIRRVAYLFMVDELKKIVKKRDSKIDRDKKEADKESLNKSLEAEYFDHTLYMIKDDRYRCPFDLTELAETYIVEKIYDNPEDLNLEKNPIYKEIEVRYCVKCKNCFIKNNYKNKIEGHIKVIPIQKTILPSVESVESFEAEFNLNEESPLRIRGYHTGLSDNERWNILKDSCIPEIGVNRVLFYLESFVKRFSAQKKKDYSNSIRIWEKDIRACLKNTNHLFQPD